MKLLVPAALCVVLSFATSGASAQPPARPEFLKQIFKTLDADGDGRVSIEEFEAGAPNPGQLPPLPPPQWNQGTPLPGADAGPPPFLRPPFHALPDPEKIFDHLDADGNDEVSRKEFKAATDRFREHAAAKFPPFGHAPPRSGKSDARPSDESAASRPSGVEARLDALEKQLRQLRAEKK